MKPSPTFLHKHWKSVTTAMVFVFLVAAAATTHQRWLPAALSLLSLGKYGVKDQHRDGNSPAHAAASHDNHHAGDDEANSLELSKAAQKNIGLRTARVELQEFVKTISVPGLVVERTGRSQIDITAPMAGIVTKVHPIEGEALSTFLTSSKGEAYVSI